MLHLVLFIEKEITSIEFVSLSLELYRLQTDIHIECTSYIYTFILQEKEQGSGRTNSKASLPLQLFVGSVVGISMLTFVTGCGLGLLIGLMMKSKQTKPQVPYINPSTQEGEEAAPVTGSVYEEVQLRDLPGEIYLSQNVAYDKSCIN